MLDENSQAILLLSTYFSAHRKGDTSPLTPVEYGRFARWLLENHFQPKDLLRQPEVVLKGWSDPKAKINSDRVNFLLGRGMAMGLALEKWTSAGIWIITRADSDYPERLKRHLKEDAPPLLFGVGNRALLNAGGLAMVGSRNIDATDETYARELAQRAANEGMNVVSGGARGVDETAMLAALEVEGTALGVLANDLLKAALSNKWRSYLKSKQCCLVSICYPEAPFNVDNAMGRNKYIYSLADYGLVIRSDKDKGGTWAGAKENQKKGLVPLFVKADSNAAGNAALLELGALPLGSPQKDGSASESWLKDQLEREAKPSNRSGPQAEEKEVGIERPTHEEEELPIEEGRLLKGPDVFFSYFVKQLLALLQSRQWITLKELKELYPDLAGKQITDWLSRAVAEKVVARPAKAHKYIINMAQGTQQSLFKKEIK